MFLRAANAIYGKIERRYIIKLISKKIHIRLGYNRVILILMCCFNITREDIVLDFFVSVFSVILKSFFLAVDICIDRYSDPPV